jgi:hypothetical protein
MALAAITLAPQAGAEAAKKAGQAVLVPAGEMKWADVADFPGVKMAVLQGDPAKGPACAPNLGRVCSVSTIQD